MHVTYFQLKAVSLLLFKKGLTNCGISKMFQKNCDIPGNLVMQSLQSDAVCPSLT